ncbi:hypothetical protein QA584_15685 [Anaerocolumna sp. AGMB13025]|uniref:hypothetical protein n=1 Tax=Anaerocolumna sp. AGMB13025 TaxID=3039116 RepID=UPI00241D4E10|nr:hypothetical protein [Anaerocolumna sp. AGMB13025]WFR55052.1 hypothetical protein QA584_15685 [Anaerocolumna sp. AGMB13025]
MNYRNESLYKIESEYYLIFDEFYGSFYQEYKKSGKEKVVFIKKYLDNQKSIILCSDENNLSYRRNEFRSRVKKFWDDRKKIINEGLNSYSNIGLFGACDDKYVSYYETEIKQNALYYDLLILNDPFYTPYANKRDNLNYSFINTFYKNVLELMDLKSYVLTTNKEIFAIIYPTNIMTESNEEEVLYQSCRKNAVDISKNLFGVDYSGETELWKNIEILKSLSDLQIEKKMAECEIYINMAEAQQYEWDTMEKDTIQQYIQFMNESWGCFNKDFMRCVLNYAIINNIITTNHYTYKMHCKESINFKANPIFNKDEWEPFLYEVAGNAFPASDEFKYMCAIHRNDKLAEIVELSSDEILDHREYKNVTQYRDFLGKAVASIHNTPDQFEEIAIEVFSKIDELLDDECKKIAKTRKMTSKKAIWGLGKAIAGYIPYISYIPTTLDVGLGIKSYANTLKDKESILETINKRNKNR